MSYRERSNKSELRRPGFGFTPEHSTMAKPVVSDLAQKTRFSMME
jgi:hypothetical protein